MTFILPSFLPLVTSLYFFDIFMFQPISDDQVMIKPGSPIIEVYTGTNYISGMYSATFGPHAVTTDASNHATMFCFTHNYPIIRKDKKRLN